MKDLKNTIKGKTMIIGSTAIKHHFFHFKREPKDLDIAIQIDQKNLNSEGVEYLYNPVLKYEGEYASPEVLLTLKMSHLFWDIGWDKHMYDAQFLIRNGIVHDEALLWELISHWKEVKEPVRRSELEMSKEEFFSNAINYDVMEHDDLHLLVSSSPMYKRLLKEGCEVELDGNNWYRMSHEEKILTIREEVYVMAFERYKNLGYRFAYNKMLKKFLRQHIPEFMFTFAVLNWVELDRCPIDFLTLINYKMTKKAEEVTTPQTIDLKVLNKIFFNLGDYKYGRLTSNGTLEEVETVSDSDFGNETSGGDTFSNTIYKVVGTDFHIRVTIGCDSYGDSRFLSSIQFVTKKIVEKLDFVPIN